MVGVDLTINKHPRPSLHTVEAEFLLTLLI